MIYYLIEYEIFPLRALCCAYELAKSPEEARAQFLKKKDRATVRRIQRCGQCPDCKQWTPLMETQAICVKCY